MPNAVVDALANATVRMLPLRDNFTIKILYSPSIPDNIINFLILYNDQHKLHFMANVDVFKDAMIDEDGHE